MQQSKRLPSRALNWMFLSVQWSGSPDAGMNSAAGMGLN